MWQEINYFLWGGSVGIEKKEAIAKIITAHGGLLGGGFHLWMIVTTDPLRGSFPRLRHSLAWSFSQYAISAGTLVAIDGRDGGELMVLGEEVPHENGG